MLALRPSEAPAAGLSVSCGKPGWPKDRRNLSRWPQGQSLLRTEVPAQRRGEPPPTHRMPVSEGLEHHQPQDEEQPDPADGGEQGGPAAGEEHVELSR